MIGNGSDNYKSWKKFKNGWNIKVWKPKNLYWFLFWQSTISPARKINVSEPNFVLLLENSECCSRELFLNAYISGIREPYIGQTHLKMITRVRAIYLSNRIKTTKNTARPLISSYDGNHLTDPKHIPTQLIQWIIRFPSVSNNSGFVKLTTAVNRG